jgi:hypothetical protein
MSALLVASLQVGTLVVLLSGCPTDDNVSALLQPHAQQLPESAELTSKHVCFALSCDI